MAHSDAFGSDTESGDREFREYPEFEMPAYMGSISFHKLPWCPDQATLEAAAPAVAIVGVPFDSGASYRPGARFGPRAIREASYLEGNLWSIQLGTGVFSKLSCVDAGDAPVLPFRPERSHRVVREKIRQVASCGTIPITLGGDHSITYPIVAALSEFHAPRRIGVIHFDAHADTGSDTWGWEIGHGQPMRRLIEGGWVSGHSFVQVGLRGYWPEAPTFEWMAEQGIRWHPMTEIEMRGSGAVVASAITEATEQCDGIYLTVDVDVLDPSVAPGTGTPEPGGMLARELLSAVREVVRNVDLVGMDVVEVCPPFDQAGVTAAVANRCVLEALSALASKEAE